MALSRNLWPGKDAWVTGPEGEESESSRHARREARERAIRRRRHPGPLRRALARARGLLRRS